MTTRPQFLRESSQSAAWITEQRSHLLLTMEYLESTGTFRKKREKKKKKSLSLILTPLFPPIFKLCTLSPADLNISPFCLTPITQSKPQSALAWIKELLGIPSVSTCVAMSERERLHICVLPGCQSLYWVSMNSESCFHDSEQCSCKCVLV